MINSICLVRLSALGDVLMAVPLVRTLQANFPKAKITWIISRPAYNLVEGMEGVEFIEIEKPDSLSDLWRFRNLMKDRSFDVLLAAQASFRANLLYPFIRAKRKIGYDKRRAKDGHAFFVKESIAPGQDHTLEGFLKFAQVLGSSSVDLRWDLPVSDEDRVWANSHLPAQAPFMLINPAASKPERSWLVDRYIDVIKQVQSHWNMKVVLTGGPGAYDRELADAILAQTDCIDLVGKTRPKQLLAVIERGQVMLCPDTGPSHMAAAMGTPVIALHAVTSPQVSGPYPFRHLAVDCYDEAVIKILGKTRQTSSWGTQAHGMEAMKLVTVDAVLDKLRMVIAKVLV